MLTNKDDKRLCKHYLRNCTKFKMCTCTEDLLIHFIKLIVLSFDFLLHHISLPCLTFFNTDGRLFKSDCDIIIVHA